MSAGCAGSSGFAIKALASRTRRNAHFVLDSPIIRQTEDHYGPVRFMHAKHAVVVKDCALCHHHRPLDEAASKTVRCSACHQQSVQQDHLDRLGLKSARWLWKGPSPYTLDHRKEVELGKATRATNNF